jgi:hypothetical protein
MLFGGQRWSATAVFARTDELATMLSAIDEQFV